MKTDHLIIGSGIAGLTYALRVAEQYPDQRVRIVTKERVRESNTRYAQGGIAVPAVETGDSIENHIRDTLRAGGGACDEAVVRMIVEEGMARVQEMIDKGFRVDRGEEGTAFGREGGHSHARILHVRDRTGEALMSFLLERVREHPRIEILEERMATDLITDAHLQSVERKGKRCFGAFVLDQQKQKVEPVTAFCTFLATGGCGQLWEHSTNSMVATGDGIGMAYRAGSLITDTEFVQFHPTAMYGVKEKGRAFLVSEAVRGAGAVLRDPKGSPFMARLDERQGLAPRDVVSRAIDREMKKWGTPYVHLDCKPIGKDRFERYFPGIAQKCKEQEWEVPPDPIPVVPAAHYICGGVKTDKWGRTGLKGLYAGGENACTGMHGANRLASNSLLEALVMGDRSGRDAGEKVHARSSDEESLVFKDLHGDEPVEESDVSEHRKELQRIMATYGGIVRTNDGLLQAAEHLKKLDKNIGKLEQDRGVCRSVAELKNMLATARLVIRHSRERTRNLGVFWNADLACAKDKV